MVIIILISVYRYVFLEIRLCSNIHDTKFMMVFLVNGSDQQWGDT